MSGVKVWPKSLGPRYDPKDDMIDIPADTIQLAEDVFGRLSPEDSIDAQADVFNIARAIHAAVLAERERCAREADAHQDETGQEIAAAIRAFAC